jgi:AraC-like DNA-binding protein
VGFSSALIIPLLEVAERADIKREWLLSRAGVDERLRADRWFSDTEYGRVVESVQQANEDPLLGLHAGALTGAMFSPVGHAAVCAPSMRAGLAIALRFAALHHDGEAGGLEESGELAHLTLEFPRVSAEVDRVTSEGIVMRFLRGADAFGDRARWPVRVFFEHAPRARVSAYQELLGCEVVFGADRTRIEFPRHALDQPSRLADRELFQSLQRHVERCLRQTQREALSRNIQRMLQDGISETRDAGSVAQALGLSTPDFRKLLRERGTSFRKLLDDARRSLAEELLLDLDVPVKNAAYSLGFSDPSAFNRAVRRWTGYTPLQYRRLHADRIVAASLAARVTYS